MKREMFYIYTFSKEITKPVFNENPFIKPKEEVLVPRGWYLIGRILASKPAVLADCLSQLKGVRVKVKRLQSAAPEMFTPMERRFGQYEHVGILLDMLKEQDSGWQ